MEKILIARMDASTAQIRRQTARIAASIPRGDPLTRAVQEIAQLWAPPPEGATLIRELCRIANVPPGPFISAGASPGQVFTLLFRDTPLAEVRPLADVREVLRIMQARCSGCMSCTLRTSPPKLQ